MADIDQHPDRIAELFENKTILITGGTGFIGKLILEKLLRSCGNLEKIFIIIRAKRNKTSFERFNELAKEPIFDMVKQQKGENIMKKVELINGDFTSLDISLSKQDKDKLKEEVDVIIHSAATVKLNEDLKTAILLNVRGTKVMLQLASECKKLSVFVHLSTAYCNTEEKILYEKLYTPPHNPHNIIEMGEKMSKKELADIKKKILGRHPNTYSFTKALAEGLVGEKMDVLPIIVLRPSIVVPIWREPIPGWTENKNGPVGILLGAAKGLSRIMYCNGDCHGDFVPADIVVNAILAATFDYFTNKSRRVFNITSLLNHKVNYFGLTDLNTRVVTTKIPLNYVAWYPKLSLTQSKLYYNVRFYLLQMLPAVIGDIVLLSVGLKPYLTKIQNRIHIGLEILEFYTNNEWEFSNRALFEARSQLNPKEQEIYEFNCDKFNCIDYYTNCVRSIRLHILRETDDTIPLAKRHLKIMWYVDRIVKTCFMVTILFFLWNKVIKNFMNIGVLKIRN